MRVNEVAELIQAYYIERNIDHLIKAVGILDDELHNPRLQEGIITIPVALSEAEETINSCGYLKFKLDDADSDQLIVVDKLARVVSSKKDEGCMVLNVAFMDGNHILLVPGGGE